MSNILPAKFDLICYRGQTWSRDIIFRDKTTKDPLDLSGQTAQAQIRPKNNSSILTAEMTCLVVGEEGRVTVSLPSTITSEINPGIYAYDVKLISSDGDIDYYAAGNFVVTGRVTE